MAQVEVKTETRIKGFTLHLTPEEAQLLRLVLGHISGPVNGPRRLTEALWRELVEAGAERPEGVTANTSDGSFWLSEA